MKRTNKEIFGRRRSLKGTREVQPDMDLLSADAGKVLAISTERVRQLADAGRLKYRRTLGGIRIFRMEDVLALKAERDKKAKG